MNATFGKASALLLLAGALSFAPSAYAAPPSAENVATARELYKQGADALDAGDAKAAVDKLGAAWSLAQTPLIGFDLARAHAKLGHLVEAREAALAVVRLPPVSNETPRSSQARAAAEKMSLELAPKIPHVKLTLVGAADDAMVKLDGSDVPAAALSVPRQANPGPHTATVDFPDGRHVEGSATVAEGETKEITLTVPPKPATPDAATDVAATTPKGTGATTQPTTSSASSGGGLSPVVWVGVAIAAAGLGTGGVTGAIALNGASNVQRDCPTIAPSDGAHVCLPQYQGELSDAKTMATIATVGFIAAGVGAGVFVVGLLIGGKKSPEKTARVLPMLGPVSGITGTF